MPQEIKIDGIGISPDVLTAIVSRAVSDVEGIASVGVKDLATNLVSMMLSSKAPASEPAVEAEVLATSSHSPCVSWCSLAIRSRNSPRPFAPPWSPPSMLRWASRSSALTFALTASFSPRSNL